MRKKMTAIVLAVLAFSMIAASAASLGGITTSSLGAETDLVASCDTVDGIDAAFNVAFSGGEYRTTTVVISGADAPCEGLDISVTLLGSAGTALDSDTGTVAAGGGFTATIDASAEAVEGIAVLIEG